MAIPDALDQEVGQIVGVLPDGTEYRQVLLNPDVGSIHVTPDGRTWIAVREEVVDGRVIESPFTIHWRGRQAEGDVTVTFESRGADQSVIESISNSLPQHPLVQQFLSGTRNRLLYVELLDPDPEIKTDTTPSATDRFQATFYDYSNNRVIRAIGAIGATDTADTLQVAEFGDQPVPTSAEFEEALARLRDDPDFGPLLQQNQVSPYQPMPPLVAIELPDGRIERTIAVGFLPTERGGDIPHEIVGVNLIQNTVVRFPNRAPATSLAQNSPPCGPPSAGGATTGRAFVAGQAWITVMQGGTVIWKFLAVRPAATKGPGNSTNGTGIELRFVDYRGKRVLYRAHVPILNVKYNADACGPYRDWQNEEGVLATVGNDVAPGFRLCSAPATTILDTGSDGGNFLGVAIYVQGQEVVLVSQMHAGWYRYVSEWRLSTGRASASAPHKAPVFATSTIITSIGGSISIFVHPGTTKYANSTIRASQAFARQIGTINFSRSNGLVTPDESANGVSRIPRRTRPTKSSRVRTMEWRIWNLMPRFPEGMSGFCGITRMRLTMVRLRLALHLKQESISG